MAVTVGKNVYAGQSFVVGDRVMISVDLTGDSSYPTGGWAVSPSLFGLNEIHHFDATLESGGATLAAYDYTNAKLKTFSALGTETTNATDLHTKVWRCLIVGRGTPKQVS